MNNMELSAILDWELNNAQGFDADVLATKRALALDYYYGLLPAEPGNGRSGIVSTDVADAVHSLLAQIQPIVKTTQIEFIPENEQDEATCQAESDITRQTIEQHGGFEAIYSALHDALLIGNGWIKVYVKSDDEKTEEIYPPNLPDEAVFLLSQPTAPSQKVKVTTSDTKTVVKRTTTIKSIDFDSVPPENMLFNNDSELDDLRFVAERKVFTVSELTELGFSQKDIDDLPWGNSEFHPGVIAREGIYQNDGTSDGSQPTQRAEQTKEVYCCYIRISPNGGATSELRHIWYNGGVILMNKPADYIPYITGSAIPAPHRIQGTGMFELVGPIQDAKTQILRQYIDNLSIANQSRIAAVEGQVNMGDLTNGRLNGVVRVRSADALMPLPSTDIGPQAMGGLNYLDNVRTQRVGASIDFNELQGQLMASSATAAAGQQANVEKMSGWYAGNLVGSLLKPAFMLTHKVLRLDYAQPLMGKVGNKWQQLDPTQWADRKNVATTMGLTSMEKAHRINGLTSVIQQQQMVIEKGGNNILTSLGKAYNAMSDWIRANDLGDPTEYLLDPDSPESQQAMQEQQQKQQQEQARIEDLQKQMLQMQHQFELTKQANDLQFKKWDSLMDAEQYEADLTTKLIIADKSEQTKVVTTQMNNAIDLVEGVRRGANQK